MGLVTICFPRVIKKGGFLRKDSSSKPKVTYKNNADRCYKCSKKDHFIKDCPLWETEWKKNNPKKVKQQKRDWVPRGRLTKKTVDKIVKRALAAIQISSTDKSCDKESDEEDQSLIAKVESDLEPEDHFSLMINSNSDVDNEEEPEVSF